MIPENMIYLEEQLQLIRTLHEWVGSHSINALRIFSFFDSHLYYFMVLAFVWAAISWRWGVRLLILLVSSSLISRSAKLFFDMPRPPHYDPTLGLVPAGNYGFPSGAAVKAFLLGFLLVYGWKSRWAWPCAIAYVLLFSAARVFLGVHFALDILGGWAIGLLLAALFTLTIHPVERFASQKPNAMLFSILAFSALALALLPPKFNFMLVSAITGSIGVAISTKKHLYFSEEPRFLGRRVLCGLFASGVVWLLGSIPSDFWPIYPQEIQTALAVTWISLLASPLCKKIRIEK